MATFVNDLRLKEIATGDEAGTWGTSTNTNLELIANAMGVGSEAVANASTHTITMADGTADEFRSTFLRLTGGGQACTVTLAPNTLSHTWIMRNETAAALTLTQGSGANVVIAAGQTKIVATDGAGSGAIVYEMDDLELAGNLLVGGTLGVTGIATFTDDIIIGDGKTIGSASDVDAMTIAANGQVTFTQTLIGTALDISGDIDVDGTTNLDVVDIDGAVDMASTLAVAGVVTANAGVVVDNITIDGTEIDLSSGNLTLDVAGNIELNADGGQIILLDGSTQYGNFLMNNSGDLSLHVETADKLFKITGTDGSSAITPLSIDMSAAGAATFNSTIASSVITAKSSGNTDSALIVQQTGSTDGWGLIPDNTNGNLDITRIGGGTAGTHLSITNAGAATFSSTVTAGGVVTANAGVVVDNITIDGTEIDLSSGDLTIDVAGDIVLDADGSTITFKDGGTTRFNFNLDATPDFVMSGGNASITAATQDADFTIIGNDGGSDINALTFDMSDGGFATFNKGISLGGNLVRNGDFELDVSGDLTIDADGGQVRLKDGGTQWLELGNGGDGPLILSTVSDKDLIFQGNDGGSTITALTLDMSAAGAATFNSTCNATGFSFSNDSDTGIIRGDANQINLRVGGADNFILTSSQSLFTSGTSTIPSISFISDPNTGFQNDTADNIGFVVGGSQKAFLSASQFNVTGNGVFSGSISKGSGSFKIDHPLPAKTDTHHLVHSFVEAPQADNIYRGSVDLVGGSATVNIDTAAGMTDGTFVLLNTNVQCFTSNESGWTAIKGSVSGNTLTITAQDNSCTDTISWMVVGERHDQHMKDTEWTDSDGKVIVEPKKTSEGE